MQLRLDTRLARLVRALPPISVMRLGELAMSALVALLAARLVWAVVTPVTPVGDWAAQRVAAAPSLAISFDPFFRNAPESGPAVVTSLEFKLFGVRMNEASGGGSAIIEVPGEGQQSYAVGDAIQPGVILKAVAFDHVIVTRGGADEQLFLDQTGSGSAAAAPANAAPASGAAGIETLAGALTATPRSEGGIVTGVTVRPGADAAAFAATGLQPGDVLTRVNGERVAAIEDIVAIVSRVAADGPVQLDVERGGQRITISREFRQ